MSNSTIPTIVSALGVLGIWIIAVLALAGDKIRARLFRPTLNLELVSATGEVMPLAMEESAPVQARRFYLRVANAYGRFSVAHAVQVMVTKVEFSQGDSEAIVQWSGMVPLIWQHQQLYGTTHDIGTERLVDFFYVSEKPELAFRPMIPANNFPLRHTQPVHLWVTAMARATECDSVPLRLQIKWDGAWPPNEASVSWHLSITREGKLP